jgi:hypothetical protein
MDSLWGRPVREDEARRNKLSRQKAEEKVLSECPLPEKVSSLVENKTKKARSKHDRALKIL